MNARRFRPIAITLLICLVVLAVVVVVGRDFVVERFAFYPDRSTIVPSGQLPPAVSEVYIRTSDGERLRCFYLPDSSSDRLLIYFHGNGANIDRRLDELDQLRNLGISVLGVGYRGYGGSSGRPSEEGIYEDGRAALRFATDSLHVPLSKLFLCGRSLGTTVAVEIAKDIGVAGVILVTPLTSGKEFAAAHRMGFLAPLVGGKFDNRSKCGRIASPVLVIHGTMDRVVPYAMGKALYDAINSPKIFVTVKGGNHNELEHLDPMTYWGAIQDFLDAN
jgi:fermentation-respiration switch protein FrsA (DUF1100 family)